MHALLWTRLLWRLKVLRWRGQTSAVREMRIRVRACAESWTTRPHGIAAVSRIVLFAGKHKAVPSSQIRVRLEHKERAICPQRDVGRALAIPVSPSGFRDDCLRVKIVILLASPQLCNLGEDES